MLGRQNRRLVKDEVIFLEGEVGDCAYLIEQGHVLISLTQDGAEIPLRILGPGEVFGEMSLIDSSLRSASAKAISETQLIIVTKEQLLDRIQSSDPVVRLLLRVLLERLRTNSNSLRSGKSPTSSHPDESHSQVLERSEALEQIRLENRIASALDGDQFRPYYQPIFDLKTGQTKGCEALIRWISADGTVILPEMFMDAVESSSLVLRAGNMIVEKCLADMQKFLKLDPDFFVSINVSARQFADPSFIVNLEKTRMQRGIQAAALKLEVTERVMMEGPQALETLIKCRALGYALAIDDFGTGFSSLQYLAAMPLTDLKIDRSFVKNILTNEKSLMVIKALINLAHLLGMNLIAEGIETQEQLTWLSSLGVSMGQGYYFAKPLPLDEMVKWLEKPKKGSAAS